MKKTVTYCDHCGATGTAEFGVVTGTYSDPCEGTKQDKQFLDLCFVCATTALRQFLNDLGRGTSDYLQGAAWAKKWGNNPKGGVK